MRCERCGLTLEDNHVNNFQGKVLCEDYCFDLLNPSKVCDPIAVSSTLSVRRQLGQTGTNGLSELQKQIYGVVAERGRVSREVLMERFGLSAEGFEREFAVLRHCELLRGFKEGKTVYFTKY